MLGARDVALLDESDEVVELLLVKSKAAVLILAYDGAGVAVEHIADFIVIYFLAEQRSHRLAVFGSVDKRGRVGIGDMFHKDLAQSGVRGKSLGLALEHGFGHNVGLL